MIESIKGTRPMSELLPWLFPTEDEKTVVCKDSSLLAVFAMRGVDSESGDEFGLNDAAEQFDEVIRFAAAQQVRIWTRADRHVAKTYSYGTFTNEMAREIDQIWGSTFQTNSVFSNSQVLAIAMPTQKRGRTVAEMARDRIDDGESIWKALPRAAWDKVRSNAKDKIGFESRDELESARLRFEQNIVTPMLQKFHLFNMRRLAGQHLYGFLKSCTSTGEASPTEHNEFSYLDAELSDSWLDNSYRDQLLLEGSRRQWVGVLTLKSAPSANKLAALDTLMALPMRLTIANCWKPSPKAMAISDLKSARTFDELSRMDIKSLLRTVATKQDELIESDSTPQTKIGQIAESYISDLKDGDGKTAWGYLATSILVYAGDSEQLERNMERVEQVLTDKKLIFLREREGAISGFCVGIPGNVIDPARWFHVEASNVTDLAPIITLDQGSEVHPFFSGLYKQNVPNAATMRTRYGTTAHMSYHTGALGHTIYIGPSRNGKTMQKMFMTSQLLKYPNARAVIFDKDHSCEAPTLLQDGVCIDLTPGALNSSRMNPLIYVKKESSHPFLIGWIDRLMSARGPRLTDIELDLVTKAIKSLQNLPRASLTSLQVQLPESLKVRLAPWCKGGVWGEFFDHPDDELTLETITCFEVGGLIAANLTDVLRAFTDYVFFRITDMLNDRKEEEIGPTEIYFEEAGLLLDDPIFAEKAVDYLTTLAKKQAYLVMTAQSPEPFFRNERLRAAVRDNVPTVIFLPNKGAARGDLAIMLKKVFGVNDNHLNLIHGASPKREYCIWHPQTGRFRVGVMNFPNEIQARLMSDSSSRAILNETYSPADPIWKKKYLQRVMAHLSKPKEEKEH